MTLTAAIESAKDGTVLSDEDLEKFRSASQHYLFLRPLIEEIDRLRAALRSQYPHKFKEASKE
jgi:hypothetical protein